LKYFDDVTSFVASSAEAFPDELRTAARSVDRVVVAGGDGTFGRAVNSLADRRDEIAFALVPVGTGNDLARTIGLVDDPVAAASWLAKAATIEIDLGRADWGGGERFFVNACVGGFSVAVDEALEEATKRKLGRFAFWLGGLKAASDVTRYRVKVDDRSFDDVVVVGIGNGRTVGGGLELWPEAQPDDGQLEVCVISAPDLGAGMKAAARVKAGTHEGAEGIVTMRAASVSLEADPPMELNADGELVGLETPATFDVAGKIRMLVPARSS
jgi:diacylglycerol kinase (ATP)